MIRQNFIFMFVIIVLTVKLFHYFIGVIVHQFHYHCLSFIYSQII